MAAFPKQINHEVPKDLDIQLIANNFSSAKQDRVLPSLVGHTCFHMNFTPISSSWMNLVECFLADLTADCVLAGNFTSAKERTATIAAYSVSRNEYPRPYRWKASGEEPDS